MSFDKICKKRQQERTAELERLTSEYPNSEDRQKILDLGWDDLLKALQSRELTATVVLEAYTAKALEATKKCNSITEFNPKAKDIAKELDNCKEPKGPLHGIPFCVKDDCNVEGMDTTIGYAKNLYKPAEESAAFVKTLVELGAVPFCKTNVPQTMFTYGSDNPVFGQTTNAINQKLSPGGSSSGTGSLVGSHGCMFGTGSDIGGSVRIPAHFNGVAGIMPTVGRISEKGLVSPSPNLVGFEGTAGILGQTAAIVSSVFRGISENFPQRKYDPKLPPISWNHSQFDSQEKLRIGYFTSIPFFPPLGDTEEVVLKAKSSLESLGHTLVPFKIPDAYNYMRNIGAIVLADNAEYLHKTAWKGEPVAESMKLAYYGSLIPIWAQRLIAPLVGYFSSTRMSSYIGASAKTTAELWTAYGEKQRIIKEILDEWQELKLDAVICPVFPFPAPPVSLPGQLPVAVAYTMIWNLADFPAGVMPFGVESGKKIDKYETEKDAALEMAKEGIKESIGLPIGVQIVSLPFNEEVVLRLMCELEKSKF